jgi:hypothetical protein
MASYIISRLNDQSAAAGTAKTMIRIAPPPGNGIKIASFWLEGDSIAASDHPLRLELLIETTTAAPTGTSFTPYARDGFGTSQSTAVVNCTAEASPTVTLVEAHNVVAAGGLYYAYPLGDELVVLANQAFRMRVTAPTTQINLTYGCTIRE